MSYRISLLALVFFVSTVNAQFKNDNVLYKTVDPADLCSALDANKGYLLLDVRSRGEHFDTSSFAGYNLGHFKGAANIDINELGNRWRELSSYKDKPVFIYCSHSQRSRRASKMLVDSGFTKVYNINGGMTAFHYMSLKNDGCLSSVYETNNSYKIISFNELCERKQKGNPFILDVRSDSAFRHIHPDPKTNASGIIKGSVNIPLAAIENNTASLPVKEKEIIITDLSGVDAAKTAVLLTKNGFKNVSVLVEGIDRILSTDAKNIRCPEMYISPSPFKTFNATEFARYIKANPNVTLVDVRSAEEFNNTHKDNWRNIGQLKNAINIPVDKLSTSLEGMDRDKVIIVYSFSGGQEVYKAGHILNNNKFSNVKVLTNGIFNVRWSSGNIKGMEWMRELVVNVPEINQPPTP